MATVMLLMMMMMMMMTGGTRRGEKGSLNTVGGFSSRAMGYQYFRFARAKSREN